MEYETTSDKSFKKLTDTYQFIDNSGAYPKIDNKDQYRSDIALLSFLRSGLYVYSNGALTNQKMYGYYWTHHMRSVSEAHYLYVYNTYVGTLGDGDRGRGYSLRCLAR